LRVLFNFFQNTPRVTSRFRDTTRITVMFHTVHTFLAIEIVRPPFAPKQKMSTIIFLAYLSTKQTKLPRTIQTSITIYSTRDDLACIDRLREEKFML
jgi:hypothetical protein